MSEKPYKFHPLSDMFPLMEGEEFEALVADIKVNGLRESIVTYKGMILDGRNRYRACMAAGVEPEVLPLKCVVEDYDPDDAAATAYIISNNIHRRHLTAEQRRELIAKLIKDSPEKPDLQIAKTLKVSPTTVGAVRSKMEEAGDVSKLETRTDSTGRKQPTKKKVTKAEAKKNAAPKESAKNAEGEDERRPETEPSQVQILTDLCLLWNAASEITRERFLKVARLEHRLSPGRNESGPAATDTIN